MNTLGRYRRRACTSRSTPWSVLDGNSGWTELTSTLPADYPGTAYYVDLTNSGTNVGLRKVSSGTITELANAGVGRATTAKQWVRFRVEGSTLKVKVWTDGAPEPSAWEMQATDSSFSAPGVLQLRRARATAATDAREVFLDDLMVEDLGS